MVTEIWQDITGYEGLYMISDKGNVHSVERIVRGRKYGGHLLKPGYDKDGYRQVTLCKNGKVKTKKIHRLVTETFIPNPSILSEVNHKDENKTNNYVENLEWCTRKYNVNYGTAIERATQTQSKKVRAINIKTGEVHTFSSINEAGRKGYSGGHISASCRGVYKDNATGKLIGGDGRTYKGHKWSYE